MAIERQKEKGNKGKGLRPRDAAHNPQANVVDPEIGIVPDAVRRPAEFWNAEPETAPEKSTRIT